MSTRVPKKILHGNQSFVQRISDTFDKSPVTTFIGFPQQTYFDGQNKGENIVLILRQHPVTYLPQMLFVIALIVILVLLNFSWDTINSILGVNFAFIVGLNIFAIILIITTAFFSFIKWFYTVNIVTDERIVDLDFNNIMSHKYSEAQLERLEDVTHNVNKFLGLVFDFGTVVIQTAGSKPEFQFENVPRPRDVQDTLLDLLEMKQKGQI